MLGHRRVSVGKDLLLGAVSGVFGTWAMGPAAKAVGRFIPQPPKPEQPRQWSDLPSTEHAAEKLAEPLGISLDESRRKAAGQAIHYGYGTALGAIYGVVQSRAGKLGIASGLLLGVGLWLFGDEIAVPALKLSKPSREFPLSIHLKAFVAHLAYGVSTDRTDRLLHAVFG